MARVVIHAGMGKTGSSSIQSWLGENARALNTRHDRLVLKTSTSLDPDPDNIGFTLEPVGKNGHSSSNNFVQAVRAGEEDERRELINRFFSQLRNHLKENRGVIVSAEAFYTLLLNQDEVFIQSLNETAADHEVILAYYIRPQDTALEAAWCQWGFRRKTRPSQFLTSYGKALYYRDCYQELKKSLPNVTITLRPYRSDLLENGNVVDDFIKHILGLKGRDLPPAGDIWTNASLPLQIANLLKELPDELLWSSPHDNARLEQLKAIIASMDYTDGKNIRESRNILKAYCRDIYEKDNLELMKELGWKPPYFISPPEKDETIQKPDLKKIDTLWQSKAGPAELALISRLIEHIFTKSV